MTDPVEDPERRQLGWTTQDHFPKTNKPLDDATQEEWNEYQSKSKSDVDKVNKIWPPKTDHKTPKEIALGNDAVNHPKHYNNRSMEAIDIIEMIIAIEKNPKVAYNMSNVIKYILRFRDKGKPVEDLKKARWYLDRLINHLENE